MAPPPASTNFKNLQCKIWHHYFAFKMLKIYFYAWLAAGSNLSITKCPKRPVKNPSNSDWAERGLVNYFSCSGRGKSLPPTIRAYLPCLTRHLLFIPSWRCTAPSTNCPPTNSPGRNFLLLSFTRLGIFPHYRLDFSGPPFPLAPLSRDLCELSYSPRCDHFSNCPLQGRRTVVTHAQ